jgi:hypothetical protein
MEAPKTCVTRLLPKEQWLEAAKRAIKINPKNLPPGADPDELMGESGERIAIVINKWWGPEVLLTVGFLDSPPRDLRDRLIEHMNAWGRDANVRFVETATDPVVRISRFSDADIPEMGGYWSYIGTDVSLIHPDQPTLNLEGFTMATPDSEFYRVVRHEAGHTLGFPHEHMRRELIERLNREKVIEAFMESQGWSEQEVIDQILTPLEESSILGTANTDQTSIMCYQIDASLTINGQPILGGLDINELDHGFAAAVYPRKSG